MVLAGGGGGGGAVYLSIGDSSTTSNTTVALTNCTMTNNTAGVLGVIVNVWFALVCCTWLVDAFASRVPKSLYLLRINVRGEPRHVDGEM